MTHFFIALALLMSQGSVTPLRPDESLHYSLGGIMSGPIDLSLSFVTGKYSLRDAVLDPSGAREERQSEGQLKPEQTARLRALALAAMRKGFETRECKRAIAKGNLGLTMPIMDAMPRMEVSVAGRHAVAPANLGCWTKTADDLVASALQAAEHKSQ